MIIKRDWKEAISFLSTINAKEDITVKLLQDVTDQGYYINRSIELLREAGNSKIDFNNKIEQVIKLLILKKAQDYSSLRESTKRKKK